MRYKKGSMVICISFLIVIGSIGGCIGVKKSETGDYDDLEDPLILTISANQTSFTASDDLTIPVWVKLENIDDRSYEINPPELIRSTLYINVTNSTGDQVTYFYGLVDSPSQIITIDAGSTIFEEFTIGGPMWQVSGITKETHYYFNTTGVYTIQASYSSLVSDNDVRSFVLTSNRINCAIDE